MSTYYVDPAATGANNGSSWTDAWTTLQSAADTATAGDIIYCRGTETLTAPIDYDTNSGSTASGYIRFIGCNSGGDVDGTYFTLDGNSTAANCIRGVTTGQSYIRFENFEFKNATSNGVEGIASNDWWVFVNCNANTNGASGFDYGQMDFIVFIGCISHSNSDSGFLGDAYSPHDRFIFCVAHSNGDTGIDVQQAGVVIHSLTHDNGSDAGDYGINLRSVYATAFGCVADSETISVYGTVDGVYLFNSRITNNATGIDFGDEYVLCGWNYLHDNTTDLANPAAWSDSCIYAAPVWWKSATHTNKADVDADDGYNNQASNDFNLKTSRTYNGDGNDVVDLGIGS